MSEDKLRYLLSLYFNNSINPADCVELLNYIDANFEEVAQILNDQNFNTSTGPELDGAEASLIFQKIQAGKRAGKVVPIGRRSLFKRQWFKIAAVFLLCLSATLFITHRSSHSVSNNTARITVRPVVPGGNKAILTLANHQVIVLNNASNGIIAKAGLSTVHKVKNGELVYKQNAAITANTLALNQPESNTLTTPRGGLYQLVLADGTKVWLNSASSISYPVEFSGKDRRVQLTGEAYFEVAKNKNKPLYVIVNNSLQVRVLGTHFNITAYANDDNITTTLLEGSVQVTKNEMTGLLKPGQQAIAVNNTREIKVSPADIDEAIAWKNGYFIFNDENINDIMKKVSRWYDVDIEYRGVVKDQQFGGVYNRSKSINDLLRYLEKIGKVHFNIQERRIIVME